jgi:hypothetical protein
MLEYVGDVLEWRASLILEYLLSHSNIDVAVHS